MAEVTGWEFVRSIRAGCRRPFSSLICTIHVQCAIADATGFADGMFRLAELLCCRREKGTERESFPPANSAPGMDAVGFDNRHLHSPV